MLLQSDSKYALRTFASKRMRCNVPNAPKPNSTALRYCSGVGWYGRREILSLSVLRWSTVLFELNELIGGTRYRFVVTMLIVGALVAWQVQHVQGTVRVQQSDGSAKIYKNITVRVRSTDMRLIEKRRDDPLYGG